MKNNQPGPTGNSGSPGKRAATIPKYCDRCARRSPTLTYDDLSLRELCADCWEDLVRRRLARKPDTR